MLLLLQLAVLEIEATMATSGMARHMEAGFPFPRVYQRPMEGEVLPLPGALVVWLGPLLVLWVLWLHGHQEQSPHSQEGVELVVMQVVVMQVVVMQVVVVMQDERTAGALGSGLSVGH